MTATPEQVLAAVQAWREYLARALRDPTAWRAARPEARHSVNEWARMNDWAADVVCAILEGTSPEQMTARLVE